MTNNRGPQLQNLYIRNINSIYISSIKAPKIHKYNGNLDSVSHPCKNQIMLTLGYSISISPKAKIYDTKKEAIIWERGLATIYMSKTLNMVH